MAAIVFSSTPVKAPFQPAWAAPMTRASASANSTGPQSADEAPMARPGRSVTMRVGLRPVALERLAHDDDVGRMDLVGGQEPVRRDAHPVGDASAVLGNRGRVVGRADAGVEAAVDAFGDAAGSREVAMPDAGGRSFVQQRGLNGVRVRVGGH